MGARATRAHAGASRPDAELALDAAAGSSDAFDALYRRHADTAWRVAYSVSGNRDDAADAVAEAFTRVLQALPAGRLADAAMFRSYLLTATRNAAIDLSRRGGRLEHTDQLDKLDDDARVTSPGDRVSADVDASLVVKAFRSLPERWRSVLWLTEVEGVPPREAAALLGVTPNNVAQLAVRARAGLRERFVQAHLGDARPVADECRYCVEHLGAYVTGRLAPRDLAKVDQHLAGCEACRRRRDELEDVGGTLRRIALPLPLLLGPTALAKWKLIAATSAGATGSGGATAAGGATAGAARSGGDWTTTLAAKLHKPMLAASTGIFALGVISASVVGSPPGTIGDRGDRRSPLAQPFATPPAVVTPQVVQLVSAPGPFPDGIDPRDAAADLAVAHEAAAPAPPTEPPAPAVPGPTDAPPGDGGDDVDAPAPSETIRVGVAGRAGPLDGGIVLGDQCRGGALAGQSTGCEPPAAAADTVGVTVVTDGSATGPLAGRSTTVGL